MANNEWDLQLELVRDVFEYIDKKILELIDNDENFDETKNFNKDDGLITVKIKKLSSTISISIERNPIQIKLYIDYPYIKINNAYLETSDDNLNALYQYYHKNRPIQHGGSNKVHVLGRDRVVKMEGRKKMVTYKGKLIPLSEARAEEKRLKKK